MGLIIAGTGSALPRKKITNEELSKLVDTSDEWIVSRTGIRERRVVSEEENLVSLSAEASRKALADAGLRPDELDLIVAGTSTPDHVFPNCACEVQAAVGAGNAVCLDVSAACSGFLFALHTAEALMKTDGLKAALVIGGDTLSRHLDWQDRTTCVLFGDGAGAVVLKTAGADTADHAEAADDAETGGVSGDILSTVLGSDGTRSSVLSCPAAGEAPFVHMDGQEVFRFAVRTVPECIEKALQKAGIKKEQVSLYLLHQANVRIIDAVARRLSEPPYKFPTDMDKTANTSAGSIPILLDALKKDGKLHRGDILVFSGFGAGLTWGAAVLRY